MVEKLTARTTESKRSRTTRQLAKRLEQKKKEEEMTGMVSKTTKTSAKRTTKTNSKKNDKNNRLEEKDKQVAY